MDPMTQSHEVHSFALSEYLVAHENVVVVHAGGNGADANTRVVVGSMNHLTTTDVNAGVVRVDNNVTGLRIGHTRPAHKGTRGA